MVRRGRRLAAFVLVTDCARHQQQVPHANYQTEAEAQQNEKLRVDLLVEPVACQTGKHNLQRDGRDSCHPLHRKGSWAWLIGLVGHVPA